MIVDQYKKNERRLNLSLKAMSMSLLSLPAVLQEHVAEMLLAGENVEQFRMVLEVCSGLLLNFGPAYKRALITSCPQFFPAFTRMESQLLFSRAELTRILMLIRHFDEYRGPLPRAPIQTMQFDGGTYRMIDEPDTIPWHFNPVGIPRWMQSGPALEQALSHNSLIAPFDPNSVHILMRVRLHDVLLFSAHGTWCPQPGGMERDDYIAVSEVGHEGQISMTMVPADPTFSTPTVFKPAKPLERLPNEDWLQYADMVRAQHLGTSLTPSVRRTSEQWEIPECSEVASLQVDVRLLHVQPGHGDTEPRSLRWCQLWSEASHFRTQADLFDHPTDGVRIDGETVYWNLSSALPFDCDEALRGVSADGIYYTAPDSDNKPEREVFASDTWMQNNLELQSTLQPSSLHGQEHTVTSVSIGMVWSMSEQDYPPELGPSLFNLVPSRMDWESIVPSGVF